MRNVSRGDTIIEVLFAVTAFGLVAVGTLALMNRGLAMAQRSLEITQVRMELDTQAELLRFVHEQAMRDRNSSYQAEWSKIVARDSAAEEYMGTNDCPTSLPGDGFFMIAAGGSVRVAKTGFVEPATYARVIDAQSAGISVQLIRVQGRHAYDAYIQACWYSVGGERPMTTGTIVRLYDPAA